MNLGDFSISVPVKDLAAWRRCYETLNFEAFDGSKADGSTGKRPGWFR